MMRAEHKSIVEYSSYGAALRIDLIGTSFEVLNLIYDVWESITLSSRSKRYYMPCISNGRANDNIGFNK